MLNEIENANKNHKCKTMNMQAGNHAEYDMLTKAKDTHRPNRMTSPTCKSTKSFFGTQKDNIVNQIQIFFSVGHCIIQKDTNSLNVNIKYSGGLQKKYKYKKKERRKWYFQLK